jgi:uncharacterized membrane protein YeaQ/YmgE (transglycosylase-associated protein family)
MPSRRVPRVWIIAVIVGGFIIGGLARWALPGPDPMPWYATIALGVGGALLGGIIFGLLIGHAIGFLGAFIGAVILLYLYRRFAQGRGLSGAPR